MTPEQFEEIFEKTIDQFEAISKLRDFILKMATEGKLTSQLENSEADATLNQNIDLAYIPHALPTSWFWHRLDQVCIYDAGKKIEPENLDQQGWLLELEDLEKQTGRLLSRICVSERNPKSTKSAFEAGDVLYGKLRPYLTKVLVPRENGYSTSEILSLRPKKELITEDYLAICLRRPDIVSHVTRIGMGTKMPRLRTNDGKALPIPLPPLEEQKRIVAKVNELMALCDELSEKNLLVISLEEDFVSSAINYSEQYLSNNLSLESSLLNTLTSKLNNSSRLLKFKEFIRDLGVTGKLHRTGSNITSHSPYEVVRLSEICESLKYGFTASADKTIRSPKFLRITDIQKGRVNWDTVPGCQIDESDLEKFTLRNGDLVVARTGGTIGKSFLLRSVSDESVFASYLIRIRPNYKVIPEFLSLYLQTSFYWKQLYDGSRGTGQPNVNAKTLGNLLIHLPPVDEQAKITTAVNEHLKICDELETKLSSEETIKTKLLKTLVA